jgi:hypothetical protein
MVPESILVGEGKLAQDNRGREEELNQENVGLLLGQALSVAIHRVYRDRSVLKNR